MAYRLSYPSNRALSVAITVTDPGHAAVGSDNPFTTEQFHLLAVDSVSLDNQAVSDRFSLQATLIDPSHRRIEINGSDPDYSRGLHTHFQPDHEFFGGVLSNQYVPSEDGAWHFQPLKAWGVFDLKTDGMEEGHFLGLTEITTAPDRLRLTLYRDPSPLRFEWENPPYLQVPTIVVRAEQDDTLTWIGEDMGVDINTLCAANPHIESADRSIGGDLVTVPLVPAAARKQSHPSTPLALTWKEITSGWSMIN